MDVVITPVSDRVRSPCGELLIRHDDRVVDDRSRGPRPAGTQGETDRRGGMFPFAIVIADLFSIR